MHKQISFAIAAAVLMMAVVTVALYTVSAAQAQGNMTSAGGAAKNMTNATGGAAKNMTSGAMSKVKNATGSK